MGFRSTFVTEDYSIAWPQWFRDKYGASIHFPASGNQAGTDHVALCDLAIRINALGYEH